MPFTPRKRVPIQRPKCAMGPGVVIFGAESGMMFCLWRCFGGSRVIRYPDHKIVKVVSVSKLCGIRFEEYAGRQLTDKKNLSRPRNLRPARNGAAAFCQWMAAIVGIDGPPLPVVAQFEFFKAESS